MAQLSLTEVSKRFNVNRTTIYRAVSNGKLSRLSNGMFDLAEVIRVFGEPEPQQKESSPQPTNENDREIISILKSQVELLTKQLEQKDSQIDHLQRLLVAPETQQQRNKATQCNDSETLTDQGLDKIETSHEANSNASKQHDATSQNVTLQHEPKHGLLNRLDKGIKAFFRK